MKFKTTIALACILLMTVALAQNPVDTISSQVGEQINMAKGNLTQKVVQHIAEGNLTEEHLQRDLNATMDELKQKAAEPIKQNANLTPEELQQMAKDELKDQVNQRVQQPGFELIGALISLLAIAHLWRRD